MAHKDIATALSTNYKQILSPLLKYTKSKRVVVIPPSACIARTGDPEGEN